MAQKGLLIDYEFCTGCHSCEVACKVEHGFDVDEWGIKLTEIGPWKLDEDKWEWDFVPLPTQRCDLCKDRLAEGKIPTCVHHCQGICMYYGDVEDLAKKMTKTRMVLFSEQE